MDFNSITAPLVADLLVVVILAAAAIYMAVDATVYLARTVGKFFDTGGGSRGGFDSWESDPSKNKDLFVEMARAEKHDENLSAYSDAQVSAYRNTFDAMPDDMARAYGANRPLATDKDGLSDNERWLKENDPEMWEASERRLRGER